MTLRFAFLLVGAGTAFACSGSSDGGGTAAGGTAGSGGTAQAGSGSAGKGGASSGGASSGGASSGGANSGGSSAGTPAAGTGGVASGAACRIGDVVYPDGTGDFQDPFSCNMCSCFDGALACTRIGCPIECPAGTTAGTSCDSCGPVDNCEVVFHGCLDQCVEANGCAGTFCFDELCRNVCG